MKIMRLSMLEVMGIPLDRIVEQSNELSGSGGNASVDVKIDQQPSS